MTPEEWDRLAAQRGPDDEARDGGRSFDPNDGGTGLPPGWSWYYDDEVRYAALRERCFRGLLSVIARRRGEST